MATFYDQLAAADTYYQKMIDRNTNKDGTTRLGGGDLRAQAESSIQQRQDALAIAAHQEEYNDPINAAARLRAAGINPDLAGLGAAGAAAEPNMPSGQVNDTGDQFRAQTVQQTAQTTIQAFQSALGIVESIQGVQGRAISNDLLALQQNESLENYVARYTAQNPHFEDILNAEGSGIFQEYVEDIPGLSRRQKKQAQSLATSRFGNLMTLAQHYKMADDAERNRLNYWKTRGETLGLGGSEQDVIDTLQTITDLQVKYQTKRTKADTSQAMYDSAYYNAANGTEAGRADNAGALLQQEQYYNNSYQRELIQELNKQAKAGNGFAQVVLFFQMMLSQLNGVSFSSSNNIRTGQSSKNIGVKF